jgi:hypothetical protein
MHVSLGISKKYIQFGAWSDFSKEVLCKELVALTRELLQEPRSCLCTAPGCTEPAQVAHDEFNNGTPRFVALPNALGTPTRVRFVRLSHAAVLYLA